MSPPFCPGFPVRLFPVGVADHSDEGVGDSQFFSFFRDYHPTLPASGGVGLPDFEFYHTGS